MSPAATSCFFRSPPWLCLAPAWLRGSPRRRSVSSSAAALRSDSTSFRKSCWSPGWPGVSCCGCALKPPNLPGVEASGVCSPASPSASRWPARSPRRPTYSSSSSPCWLSVSRGLTDICPGSCSGWSLRGRRSRASVSPTSMGSPPGGGSSPVRSASRADVRKTR